MAPINNHEYENWYRSTTDFPEKKHGMDIVAIELIRNLQQLDTVNEYVIFVKPGDDNQVIGETANFKVIELNGGPYPFWEQVLLPLAARREGCDLLHCTSNTAPLTGKTPLVLTLHDIIYLESSVKALLRGKASRYQKLGNIYRRLIVPHAVAKSKKIITVSVFEKKRIREFFRIGNNDQLVSIYNGVGAHFRKITDPLVLDTISKKYRLPKEFFFFMGNRDPKKNTAGTLKAFADFLRSTNSPAKLVMIDYEKGALHQLLAAINEPQLAEKIVLTGYIPNEDLPAIYSQAIIFLYPSLRESFGIPIIEAMACGTPVITSNTSSMPEIGGNAAFLTDPFNPATITAAMIELYTKPEKREELIFCGYQHISQYSWHKMATRVLDLYQQLISESTRSYGCFSK